MPFEFIKKYKEVSSNNIIKPNAKKTTKPFSILLLSKQFYLVFIIDINRV
jgi:hypothetical protein